MFQYIHGMPFDFKQGFPKLGRLEYILHLNQRCNQIKYVLFQTFISAFFYPDDGVLGYLMQITLAA